MHTEQGRGLGRERTARHQHEQERVPESRPQAGPPAGQQGDGDQLDGEENEVGGMWAARRGGDHGQVDGVER